MMSRSEEFAAGVNHVQDSWQNSQPGEVEPPMEKPYRSAREGKASRAAWATNRQADRAWDKPEVYSKADHHLP
jgi:hypothetical protein